jgi:hypothetical protein
MANETLSLSITNRVSGQNEAEKLDQTLVRIGNSAEKAGKQSADFAQKQGQSLAALAAEAAALIGVEKALVAVGGALKLTATEYVAHHNSAEALVGTYRDLRIASSAYASVIAGSAAPILLTGTTLAIGLAIEETAKLTLNTAALIDQQGLLAAKSNLNQQEIQKLALVARLTGNDTEFFTGAIKNLNDELGSGKSRRALADLGVSATDAFNQIRPGSAILADIAQAFGRIQDPATKAQLSIAIFGQEGTKYLPVLDEQLSKNIAKLKDIDAILDTTARANILTFRDDMKSLGDTFRNIGDDFTLFERGIENNVAKGFAAAYIELKNFDKGLRDVDEQLKKTASDFEKRNPVGNTPGGTPNALFLGAFAGRQSGTTPGFDFGVSLNPVREQTTAVLDLNRAEKDRFAFLKEANTELEKNTALILSNRNASREGLESELAAASAHQKATRDKIEADNAAIKARSEATNKLGTPAQAPLPLDQRNLLLSQLGSESQEVTALKARIKVLDDIKEAEEQAERAAKKQQDAIKSADTENAQIALRAASAGKSRIEQLELERRASIATLAGSVKAGPDQSRLISERDQQFGNLLAQEAKKEADQLRLQKNQFDTEVNQIRGQKDFDLQKFLFGGVTLAEQGEKIRKDLETQRTITEIGLNAQRENISKDATQSIRIAELQAQPGGEFAAAEKGFQIQKQHAIDLFNLDIRNASIVLEGETDANRERRQAIEIAKAYKDLSTATADAERDHQIKILELQKERLDKLRESAGGVFDALTSRGTTGLGDFILGQFKVVEKTIFQNAAVEFGKNFTGKLTLPGQGTTENPTVLGRLLANTPLGLDPLKTATSLNTSATASNTAATIALSTALKTVGIGGGGTAGSLPGIVKDAGGLFNGVSTSGISTFSGLGVVNPDNPQVGGADTLPGVGGPFDPGKGGFSQQPSGISPTPASTGSTLSKGVGLAGAAVGVGFGINSAVNQGGLRGGLTATGSIAGGAAAAVSAGLLGASAATGPLAPILAGVALAIPLITSLLGDPKLKRDAAINKELNDNAFREPTSLSLDFNQSNAYVDRDARGLIRSSDFSNFPVNVRQPARYQYDNQNVDVPGQQGTPFDNGQPGGQAQAPNVTVHINAIDTKSILDRHADIAEAVRYAVANGAADPLTNEIRSQTRTQ